MFPTLLIIATYLIGMYFLVFWYLSVLDKDYQAPKQGWEKINKFPSVTVVIPAYNEEKNIASTMKSVISLNYPKDKLKVIVVNDGSKDRTKEKAEEFIKAHPDRSILLLSQPNSGKARAINNALSHTTTEFFVNLDADSEVHPDTLKKMIHIFQTHSAGENLAIVTPAMMVKSPANLIQGIQYVEYMFTIFISRILSRNNSIYVAPGPFSVYRTEIIKKIGTFDEGNLTEDQEIAYRAKSLGYDIKNCADAFVYTRSPRTIKALFRQRNRWYKGGLMNAWQYKKMLFNKKYGHFGCFQLPFNFIGYGLGIAALGFFGYFTLKPFFRGIKNLFIVGFDIKPYLRNLFRFDFNILDYNFMLGFFIAFSMLIILFFLFRVFRDYQVRLSRKNIISLIPDLFFFPVFQGFTIAVVLIELVFKKVQKW